MRRTIALAVGVLVALAGLLLAQSPAITPDLDVPGLSTAFVAALAMVAGLVRARSWLRHDPQEDAPAERERRSRIAVPGEEIDRRLRHAPAVGTTAADTRLLSVRRELRGAAVEVLVRFHGFSEEAANTALDAGTWTDDEVAAEFFTTRSGTGNSVTEAVTGTLYGPGPFHRRASRAADAIERLTRGEDE